MWKRVVPGVLLCAIGVLWIAQGLGAAKGSMMSGHPAYAGLGAVAVLAGLILLYSAWRMNRTRR